MSKAGYKRPGKLFAAFAVTMVLFLVLGTIAVLGVGIFGGGDSPSEPEVDAGREETSRLETQVARNPDDGTTAAVLANVYANSGRLSEAIPLYERAVLQEPGDYNLRLAFGIALLRNGNWLDAEVQLERARELAPDMAAPLFYLAELAHTRDKPDFERARELYEAVLEHSPDSMLAEQARDRLEELNATATPEP